MMDKEALLKSISKPIGKKQALTLASANSDMVNELIEFSLLKDYEIAFRAAWILELVAENDFGEFRGFVKEFSAAYLIQKNQSCQRHYTKIMMSLTGKDQDPDLLKGISLDPVVDITFEWLIDPETPVAVQCNCMDILYNLKDSFEWIREELPEQVIFLLKNGSAALQSRGKKVLAKLSSKRLH